MLSPFKGVGKGVGEGVGEWVGERVGEWVGRGRGRGRMIYNLKRVEQLLSTQVQILTHAIDGKIIR